MALVLADRVQQTGTANTTVSFTLSGSVTGFQSFTAIGNTNTTYYAAFDATGNWESGLGTYSTTGPTLTRTTVYASSNAGSAATFSGTVNVFVTYPSSRNVSLDASGNSTALGTVASGTWNGTTIGVAYGGTGVTASSGANSVMLRDASQNVAINRLNQSNTNTAAAAGITTLTAASSYSQTLTGTGTQTFRMPDATTLTTGVAFIFNNNATGTLTLQDSASGAIGTITAGGAVELVCVSTATVAGTWDYHGFLPENVTWGTNALALGSTVITGGTWNGGTIPTGYGGTGLTTFTGANNALYSTSASALAAGTLPVAAGGTGVTSSTGTGSVVLSTSPTLVTPILGTPTSGTVTNLTGTASININGTVGATTANTGAFTTLSATGVATFSAGTAALPAITTTGDTNTGIYFPAADTIAFTEGGAEAMRIDSSGNVGIGVTPSAWSGYRALQIGSTTSLWSGLTAGTNASSFYTNNGYFNGTNRIYLTTGFATEYIQGSGQHIWYNAPSGTAGNAITFTQAMTLDASGNLGIGTSSPSTYGKLAVYGVNAGGDVSANIINFSTSASTTTSLILSDTAGDLVKLVGDNAGSTSSLRAVNRNTQLSFWTGATGGSERMRITSAGGISFGATGTAYGTSGQLLQSNGNAAPTWTTVAAAPTITNDTTTSTNVYPLFAAATSGTPTTLYTGNTKYLYKPSTGELTAPAHISSNGININSATVGTSYTIASGNNGFSVGPVTLSSGVAVTVSSGQRWLVL
jgi:hypothetical protein